MDDHSKAVQDLLMAKGPKKKRVSLVLAAHCSHLRFARKTLPIR